jgi:hypothetical protein
MLATSLRVFALLAALSVAACASTDSGVSTVAPFQWTSPTKRIVLVDPDVQLTELGATGIQTPRADWTDAARTIIRGEISARLMAKGVELVGAENVADPREVQLARLYSVVGTSILVHHFGAGLKLPNKGDTVDWTLGPGTNIMRDRYDADYALFVHVRDSYSSAGRVAMMVVGAAFGVGVAGGTQVGFVSLVDLRTGNVAWFNRLVSATGDLRTEEPARRAMDNLLEDLPV